MAKSEATRAHPARTVEVVREGPPRHPRISTMFSPVWRPASPPIPLGHRWQSSWAMVPASTSSPGTFVPATAKAGTGANGAGIGRPLA